MNSVNDLPTSNRSSSIAQGVDHLAAQVDKTLQGAEHAASKAVQQLNQGAGDLRDKAASALAQAGDLTHRSLDRAREASAQVRERALHLKDAAAQRVQADPMKALMIAAAVGAGSALLLQWLRQPRRQA